MIRMGKRGERFGITNRWFYEIAPLFFLHLDSLDKVVGTNCFTRRLLGGDVDGKSVEDIFLTFGQPINLNELKEHPETPQRLNVSTSAGLPESLFFHFIPMGDETLIFGGFDVDEHSKLRRELLSINNQLNALTRELQKKNHELEELNQLKNQFLTMAAHDLRKPVSSILNYSEFLIEETEAVLTPEQRGFLNTIYNSTNYMRRLIDDFLDLGMIESGHFDLDLQPTSMEEPLSRSINLSKLNARKRGIGIRVEMEEAIPLIMMDGPKIEQVLNNLISNAIEHSNPNQEVLIRIARSEKELVVSVIDHGPGLSREETEKHFLPYQRGRLKKQDGSRSTGLGLAISKKIIEAYGGKIRVESDHGKGATFTFSLPVTFQE